MEADKKHLWERVEKEIDGLELCDCVTDDTENDEFCQSQTLNALDCMGRCGWRMSTNCQVLPDMLNVLVCVSNDINF